MRSSKQAAAEAARSNYFTATARKPFYVKKLDTPPQRMKMKKYRTTELEGLVVGRRDLRRRRPSAR